MKKILQISKYYYPYIGGVEQVARDIANSLKDKEIQQKIICFNEDILDESGNYLTRRKETVVDYVDGIEVIRCGYEIKVASQSISLSYAKELKRVMVEYQPDIVIFHYPNPFVANLILKYAKNDFKFYLYWHLDIVRQKVLKYFFVKQNKELIKRADKIIGTSDRYLAESEYRDYFGEKKCAIPLMVDESRINVNDSDKQRAMEIKNKYKDKTIAFFCGRHVPYKGLQYLVDAAKYVKDNVKIIIAGKGELTEELRERAKDNEKIEFVGRISDDELRAYLYACDIFCFPSITKNEAFGISLAEAMYYGKPAVTFTIPGSGVNYVSINQETGIECHNSNVQEYAEAIQKLADNPELREKYGKAAKERAVEKFGQQRFKKDFLELLKEEENKKLNVFIVGSKSIGQYGGYETFVLKLLQHQKNNNIRYHVACKENGSGRMDVSKLTGATVVNEKEFNYCDARCFLIHVPKRIGSAQAIFYDIKALKECCRYIEYNRVDNAIVYVLACRIGPFYKKYVNKIHKLGGKVYLNPDGHEWKRAKWSAPIRMYWKHSERQMVKESDLIICDSINIEKYIKTEYGKFNPKTTFIAYGAELEPSTLKDDDSKYQNWLCKHGLKDHNYYISVGRFVPENNFETMIREFMKSNSKKDFAVITTDDKKFLKKLDERLNFSKDSRIKFVGTVYDQELLKKIRENAYGYFHGHSVGGTNPSLLEALGSTKLNLLYDIGFNKEVAEDAALYWSLEEGNLASLINKADKLNLEEIDTYADKAKKRIKDKYSWNYISDLYEKCFGDKK